MSNQTLSILNKAFGEKRKYNIITFDTHERYQTQLCKTGHNFYAFRYDGCKEWDETYAKIPSNYYMLPKNTMPNGIQYDFILSQSKFGQFQMAKQIQRVFNLPIISLEHTLPIPSWPNQQTEAFRQMNGDINVFISEYSCKEWKMNGQIIHHSVDTDLFNKREEEGIRIPKDKILSVVNDFINRDYCCNFKGWQRITDGLPTKVIGNTPGLSKPAASIGELVEEYQQCKVFLNTSTISPVPTALLEAMACGCAVVSTATCMIPEIIKNGHNGFISNDEAELRHHLEKLLYDEALRTSIGENARKTILDRFSENKFLDKWNQTFDKIYGAKI